MIPRRELMVLGAAVLAGVAIRLLYAIATGGDALAGDEIEYDVEGRFFADGKLFWSTTPSGVPHETIVKAPGYVVWVGVLYALSGSSPGFVMGVQAVVAGAASIALVWWLGRRLFGPVTGLIAAWIFAIYPYAWLFEVALLSESLAVPLTILTVIAFLEREPTPARAAGVGALMGVGMLVRPSALFLFGAIAAAWIIAAGWKRGTLMTALTVAVAALVVVPWTIRNAVVTDGGFVPVSAQDAALYGVFNDLSANDPHLPYAWRPINPRDAPLFGRTDLSELEWRRQLISNARGYIRDHPESVPKAFYWNGLTRLWDVRRPEHILAEAEPTGRPRSWSRIAMWMWWPLLGLALFALWRQRRRPALVVPLLLAALGASVVYTSDAETRYRAPLQPLVVVLAASVLAPLAARRAAP
jgi:MYXO-CTERM domain-containing protein